ncbi:hypothetical protein [Streptomyces sp. NPDC006477]|uniref:hypothetical protein n=1 Tax=Streptomyces sp. NPDC006477 TaxID=3364747 RepID=UPI003696C5DA
MSQTVTHAPSYITSVLQSAVAEGELPQAVLLVDGDLPTTAPAALDLLAATQQRADELDRLLGEHPDTYTKWPLMSEQTRLRTIRARAAFLADALDLSAMEVAA